MSRHTEKVPLTFIDLFAGIGGTRLGFQKHSFKCVFSSEWDPFAQETYRANFGHAPHGDITKITAEEIPDFDVMVAGFPCQPFSSIGKRRGFEHPTQGTLFFEILRILEAKRPAAFLLENVKGLTTHDGGNTIRVIQESLGELGYEVSMKILDAANFAVPQRRERIYIVGFDKSRNLDGKFLFPEGSSKKVGIGRYVETGVTDRSISKHLQSTYIYKKDDGRPEVITPDTKKPVKTLVSTYHKIQRLTGTFVADGPTGLRLLTANECKAIMGFPKRFKIPVSRMQMYRQFGNSVAVPVINAIAGEIKKVLESSNAAR
jgi:DNA (cytosine-5)-methyltransferase 1